LPSLSSVNKLKVPAFVVIGCAIVLEVIVGVVGLARRTAVGQSKVSNTSAAVRFGVRGKREVFVLFRVGYER